MKNILLFIAILAIQTSYAQDSLSTLDRQSAQVGESTSPGKSRFMLRGYYHTGFEGLKTGDEKGYNFAGGSINPILMYKQSDKLFFESEFEGAFEDGAFAWDLEYADMSLILNKYMTIRAGKFLLPFGSFSEKLHPAWINRLATKPLGFGHDGISPSSDVGVELRGVFYTGPVKVNYQAYVINGPQLKDGSIEPEEAGMLKFGYMEDNNSNKATGLRIGIFPIPNSMLELGFSGLTSKVGSKGSAYENVGATLFSLDFSLVKNLPTLKSVIDIKGQYNYSKVDNASYSEPEDTTGMEYTFDNISTSYYVQLSLRPALSENKFIRNLEIVGRYSALETPEGAMWEQNPTQTAFGLNYWLDWRTVIKLGYQITDGLGGHETPSAITQNMFYVHWAMGF